MTQDPHQIWRRHAATMPYFPSAAISDAGLMLGAGTVLARMRTSESGRTFLDRDEDHDRLFALLAVATRGRAPTELVPHLKAAAKHWRSGEKVLAHIRLAYARIPPLECEDDAYRLSLADTLLQAGFAPHSLMMELGFHAPHMNFRKFPGQRHVPAGNGDASGEFDSGREGLRPQPAFLDMPVPLELPVEPLGPFGTAPGSPTVPIPPVMPTPRPGTVPKPDEIQPNRPPTRQADPDDDDPKRCPKPVPDTPHYESLAARQYTIDGHNEVNKIDPLQFGEAILYRGEYFDDCARTDDPLGRWKAGDMIELKGPTYHWLLNGLFAMTS